MSSPSLFLSELTGLTFNRIIFQGMPGPTVTAFVVSDFSFGTSAEYNSEWEFEKQKTISDAINRVASFFNDNKTGVAQISLKSLAQTISTWTGTEKPQFNIDVLFISYNPDVRPLDRVRELLGGVFPESLGLVLVAPMKYAPGPKSASGVWNIKIGTWFDAPNQILRQVNPTFSKEVTPDGRPLYAKVNVVFEPYRMISYAEFKSYFR